MSFNQAKLDKIDNQSRGIFDTYIYKTDDTCAEVQAAGYFTASRFAKADPVSWENAIIEVQCADGFGKGFIDNLGNFVFLIGGDVAPAFCAWLDYADDAFGGATFVRDEPSKEYDITTLGGGFTGINFFNITDPVNSESDSLSVENTLVTAGTPNGAIGLFLIQDQGAPSPEIICGVGNQAGTFIDFVTGAPIGAAPYVNGYQIGLTFDFSTGTALGYDGSGNSSSLTVDPVYDDSLPLQIAWIGGSADATTNVYSPNTGDRPFDLPQSNGEGYCNVIPVPPPTLCTPVTWIVNEGTPPNNQTIQVGGVNNLTVDAVSLGNEVLESGVAANQLIPAANSFTEEVKIEAQVTQIPPAPITHQPFFNLGFYHDVDQPIPTLISVLTYVPYVFGGTLIDTLGNVVGSGYNFQNPTDIAAYFDPNPQQKKYAFIAEATAGAGSIDVHGIVTPAAQFELEEVIAANIVANGFTDPTIESMTIHPSDNRVVVITYTLASGDATVSVTPSGGVGITEQTNISQPYQLASSRAKIDNSFGGDSDIVLPIAAGFDPAKPIYMVSGLGSGDVIGGQLTTTFNFGSSNFNLGEDADRWCNV